MNPSNLPLTLQHTQERVIPAAPRKTVQNPYAKKNPSGLKENANVPFVPGAYSASPRVPFRELCTQPTQILRESRNEEERPGSVEGRRTPPMSQNSRGSSVESDVSSQEGFRLFDEELARQSATRTRKSRERGSLVAKLEIPINQITEELVDSLAAEVARKLLEDKELRREMISELLPEMVRLMAVTLVEPKTKRARKSV